MHLVKVHYIYFRSIFQEEKENSFQGKSLGDALVVAFETEMSFSCLRFYF